MLTAVVDDIEGLALTGIERLVFAEDFGETNDRIERRAQLVGHLGEEIALGPVGDFGSVAGFFEMFAIAIFCRRRVELGDGDTELTGEGIEQLVVLLGPRSWISHPQESNNAIGFVEEAGIGGQQGHFCIISKGGTHSFRNIFSRRNRNDRLRLESFLNELVFEREVRKLVINAKAGFAVVADSLERDADLGVVSYRGDETVDDTVGGSELSGDAFEWLVQNLVLTDLVLQFFGGSLDKHPVLDLSGEFRFGLVALCGQFLLSSAHLLNTRVNYKLGQGHGSDDGERYGQDPEPPRCPPRWSNDNVDLGGFGGPFTTVE